MSSVAKTQRYGKERTLEHKRDIWRLIEYRRSRSKDRKEEERNPKRGTANAAAMQKKELQGAFLGLDSFAKLFAEHCKDC